MGEGRQAYSRLTDEDELISSLSQPLISPGIVDEGREEEAVLKEVLMTSPPSYPMVFGPFPGYVKEKRRVTWA